MFVRFPATWTCFVTYPTEDTSKTAFPEGTVTLKTPSEFVRALDEDPFTITLAEIKGEFLSPVTLPDNCLVCANDACIMHIKAKNIDKRSFILLFILLKIS